MRALRGVQVVATAAAAALLGLSACSTSPSVEQPTGTTAGTVSTGAAPTGTGGADPASDGLAIERSTVTVDDPTVGPLTFDVRAAGPAEAVADGRGVILLHGFPETSASWEPIMAGLAAEGYRAVAVDQRGYSAGARPGEVGDYAVTHLVDDVYGVADALGMERFHIVGHDWGSVVAWSVAGRDPERVESLTALSVGHPLAFAAARADPAGDQARRSQYMTFFRQPDSQDTILANDAAMYRGIFAGAGLDDAEIDEYLRVLGTPEALGAALNWYRAMDEVSLDSMATIEVPTLMIWSTGDGALGREQAVASETYVSGEFTYVEIPDVTHWIPAQAPDQVLEHLLPHLS
ncbi:MAG: alpha/beta hydrolase [Acidimicrobiales bacterium]|nr:alpha/beta hydrolase [Acidimicrobiales bacterium]